MDLLARQTAALINGAVAYQAEQRRAEDLAELDRAKTIFFSNISHEFRTPLTLIMGPVQEMRARAGDGDKGLREDLDVVYRNGLRLGKLVNALLDFSRIEAGRSQARYEQVDLATLTADLASSFRAAFQRAGLAFEVDCRPLDEPAYVDREMWEKVVLNLLSNALKYTFAGSVRVTLSQAGGQAVLRVSDTGVGIPPQDIPRLFERFHRGTREPGPVQRGQRHRAGPGQGTGRAARRPHHGGQRAGHRHHLHRLHPARPGSPRTGQRGAGGQRRRGRRGPRRRGSLRPGGPALAAGRGRGPAPRIPRRPRASRAATARTWPRPARPGRGHRCRCWSPTTTRTCASTCSGCCRPGTGSPRSPTGRPRWTPPAPRRRT